MMKKCSKTVCQSSTKTWVSDYIRREEPFNQPFFYFLEVSVHAPSVSLPRACNPLISFTKSIDTHNHLTLSQLTYNPIFCNNLCRFRSQYDPDNKVSNIARNCFDTCSLKAVSVVLPTRIVVST